MTSRERKIKFKFNVTQKNLVFPTLTLDEFSVICHIKKTYFLHLYYDKELLYSTCDLHLLS